MFHIRRRRARYWWPHPIYLEARRGQYPCLHRWLPCVDVTIGFDYALGREAARCAPDRDAPEGFVGVIRTENGDHHYEPDGSVRIVRP